MPTPSSAPLQTTARITAALVRLRSSTENGVYVPAMNTKIIEWSSRRMSWYARGVQTRRWYRALVPNNAQTVTL